MGLKQWFCTSVSKEFLEWMRLARLWGRHLCYTAPHQGIFSMLGKPMQSPFQNSGINQRGRNGWVWSQSHPSNQELPQSQLSLANGLCWQHTQKPTRLVLWGQIIFIGQILNRNQRLFSSKSIGSTKRFSIRAHLFHEMLHSATTGFRSPKLILFAWIWMWLLRKWGRILNCSEIFILDSSLATMSKQASTCEADKPLAATKQQMHSKIPGTVQQSIGSDSNLLLTPTTFPL